MKVMETKKSKKNKEVTLVSFMLDKNVKAQYDNYCKSNGYSLSSRVRVLLERDMKGDIINHNNKI